RLLQVVLEGETVRLVDFPVELHDALLEQVTEHPGVLVVQFDLHLRLVCAVRANGMRSGNIAVHAEPLTTLDVSGCRALSRRRRRPSGPPASIDPRISTRLPSARSSGCRPCAMYAGRACPRAAARPRVTR